MIVLMPQYFKCADIDGLIACLIVELYHGKK